MATTFYVKTNCPYCKAMKEDLDAREVSYTEINIHERPEVIPELMKITGGVRKVPVLVDGADIQVAPDGG